MAAVVRIPQIPRLQKRRSAGPQVRMHSRVRPRSRQHSTLVSSSRSGVLLLPLLQTVAGCPFRHTPVSVVGGAYSGSRPVMHGGSLFGGVDFRALSFPASAAQFISHLLLPLQHTNTLFRSALLPSAARCVLPLFTAASFFSHRNMCCTDSSSSPSSRAPLPLQLLQLFTHSMSLAKRVKGGGDGISQRSRTNLCSYLEVLLTDCNSIYHSIGESDGSHLEVYTAKAQIATVSQLALTLWKTCMHGTQDASTATVSLFNPGDPVRHFKMLRVTYGTIVAKMFSGSKWSYIVKWVGKNDAEQQVWSDYLSHDDLHYGQYSTSIRLHKVHPSLSAEYCHKYSATADILEYYYITCRVRPTGDWRSSCTGCC